jgi:hypothetical protein
MSAAEFRAALAALDMTQKRLAELLEADKATPNRWALGTRPVPKAVELLLQAWTAAPELIPSD